MARGKEFEMEVLEALHQALKNKELPLSAKNCKIFHHKQYYSRDRRSSIIFDIAIEMYFPKSRTPFIVWIWECKDYTHAVPVEDAEEFHSKLEQIGADKTKGTIIARGRFQKGALEFAKSKGIGLARLLKDAQIDHVAYARGGEIVRAEHEPEAFTRIMTTDSQPYQHFYALTSGGMISQRQWIVDYIKDEFLFQWTIASMHRTIARWKRANAIRKLFGLPPKPPPPPRPEF